MVRSSVNRDGEELCDTCYHYSHTEICGDGASCSCQAFFNEERYDDGSLISFIEQLMSHARIRAETGASAERILGGFELVFAMYFESHWPKFDRQQFIERCRQGWMNGDSIVRNGKGDLVWQDPDGTPDTQWRRGARFE